jgi:hypothetical protein
VRSDGPVSPPNVRLQNPDGSPQVQTPANGKRVANTGSKRFAGGGEDWFAPIRSTCQGKGLQFAPEYSCRMRREQLTKVAATGWRRVQLSMGEERRRVSQDSQNSPDVPPLTTSNCMLRRRPSISPISTRALAQQQAAARCHAAELASQKQNRCAREAARRTDSSCCQALIPLGETN